jgi:hypothetical protein
VRGRRTRNGREKGEQRNEAEVRRKLIKDDILQQIWRRKDSQRGKNSSNPATKAAEAEQEDTDKTVPLQRYNHRSANARDWTSARSGSMYLLRSQTVRFNDNRF